MADFDPRQLDLLEDALEGLEDIDDLESLELSPALTERLAEYQDVLALCREAFPDEEPREDLLADVLAEAHAVSRRPKLREADGSGWRRFWDRWRGTLIPGLALAGTAAAVLLLLEPEQRIDHGVALSSDEHGRDEQKASNESDSAPSEPASEPSVEQDEGDDELEPTPELEAVEPGPEPALGTKPTTKLDRKRSKPAKPKPEPAAPAPEPEPLSKDETWTALERANSDRRKGDCDRARGRYEKIIAASSDNLAVARAKAGIGLCLEQERRNSEADQWFRQARSAHAGIDSWIENQRDEQPLPGETKKSKRKAIKLDADPSAL